MGTIFFFVLVLIGVVIGIPLLLFNKINAKIDKLDDRIDELINRLNHGIPAKPEKGKQASEYASEERETGPTDEESLSSKETEGKKSSQIPDAFSEPLYDHESETEEATPEDQKEEEQDEGEKTPYPEASVPEPEEASANVEYSDSGSAFETSSHQGTEYANTQDSSEEEPYTRSFAERFPDLEKFIGENVINKIGIAILVLGIGFFVRLAISENWIGEIGRVMIGILSGGVLLFFANRVRERFPAFSSVLVGGGIAVLYFTITIAFQQYQLLSQTLAFVVMILITGFTVLLSLGYNRVELAVLALLGGFASPFLVSTGEGNYIVLFTYLLILNSGMLTLAYFKHWHLVNILAYLATIIIFGLWLFDNFFTVSDPPYWGPLIFATLFYLVFFAMSIIYNLKVQRQFDRFEFSILLSNTALYYAAGMGILDSLYDGQWQGLFTAWLAVFNFIFAFYFYKQPTIDRNFRFLLIGLVMTFLSLIGPIQLSGNYITLFWSLEAVLLLWLAQKSGINLMTLGSLTISGLMLISLIMDWDTIYIPIGEQPLIPIFNKGFITGLFATGSLFGSFSLLKNYNPLANFDLDIRVLLFGLGGIMTLVAFSTGILELHHQMDLLGVIPSVQRIISGLYIFIFLTGVYYLLKIRNKRKLVSLTYPLMITAVVIYPIVYHQSIAELRDAIFEGSATFPPFLLHLLIGVFPFFFLYRLYRDFKKGEGRYSSAIQLLSWFASVMGVIILSQELNHWVVLAMQGSGYAISTILENTVKIGYPILWGLLSFALMWSGMRFKFKPLRIISLSLFFLTLMKLFFYDIQDVSQGGKIAAFISLGILLLIVSFMYQRLKKLVLESDKSE